jgi:cell wall-associated NlpC family hydrolase
MTEPQQGDFGLVKINGYAGRLIRIGQALNGDGFDDYEHAFLYLGNGLIIEAEPGGARINELTYTDVRWSTGIVPLTDKQRTRIAISGFTFEHVPYSAMDYFALAAHRVGANWVYPDLKRYVATSKHMICSQLVDRAYRNGGVQLFNDKRWDGDVTPGTLDKRLKNPHNYV